MDDRGGAELATWQQINAAMAFIDGGRHGRALPQIRYFGRHNPTADPEPDADAGEAVDDEDDEEEEEDEVGASGEFTRRIMAVEDRTQHATDVVLAPLLAATASVAQDLVNVWTAYGRFCRSRLGVPPEVMMRAWEMPLLADVELMLKDYAAVRPQPEKVAEYADCCCATWDRRFGGPEGGDGQ